MWWFWAVVMGSVESANRAYDLGNLLCTRLMRSVRVQSKYLLRIDG